MAVLYLIEVSAWPSPAEFTVASSVPEEVGVSLLDS